MSHAQYFKDKQQKQEARDQTHRTLESTLFKGCAIYVNGYTTPWNRLKLHKEIINHGGVFKQYLANLSAVTHIVASNLTLKKRVQYAKQRVVSPQWIIDSIHRGKLLPWQDYSILGQGDHLQGTLALHPSGTRISDCNHPSFINNYLQNSRLHLLSNWKSKLRKDYLSNHHVESIPSLDYTYLHIDFDSFFATVAYLYRPPHLQSVDFDRDPIVVSHSHGHSDIASCNYVARKYGIHNGMWVNNAKTLLPKGINLVCLPYNFDAFKENSRILFDTLNNEFEWVFHRRILPLSIDECIALLPRDSHIDIMQLCHDIRMRINELTQGCVVSIGCGESQIDAKLALKLAKPNGVYIIDRHPPPAHQDFLSHLKVEDLPSIGNFTTQKLHQSHPSITNLKQLNDQFQTLPALQQLLGNKLGEKIFLALRGKDDSESQRLITHTDDVFTPKSFSLEINWGVRFSNIKQIDLFLQRAGQYLVLTKLNDSPNYKISSISLKILKRHPRAPIDPPKFLGCGHCITLQQRSNLGIPTDKIGIISTELQSLFRSLDVPPCEVRGVGIQFMKLARVNIPSSPNPASAPAPAHQLDRLDPQPLRTSPLKKLPFYNNMMMTQDLPSTYERNFIDQLPTDIQKELIKDRQIQTKIKTTKLSILKQKIIHRSTLRHKTYDHLMGDGRIMNPIKFQNLNDFAAIVDLVKKWVKDTSNDLSGPHIKDIRLFKRYLIKLHNVGKVHMVLRLANVISMELNLHHNNTAWDKVLFEVVLPVLKRDLVTLKSKRKVLIDYEV